MSNQAIANSEWCSNFSNSDLKFKSQTYGVMSSAKLQMSVSFYVKDVSLT